jgi:hypothetical protein
MDRLMVEYVKKPAVLRWSNRLLWPSMKVNLLEWLFGAQIACIHSEAMMAAAPLVFKGKLVLRRYRRIFGSRGCTWQNGAAVMKIIRASCACTAINMSTANGHFWADTNKAKAKVISRAITHHTESDGNEVKTCLVRWPYSFNYSFKLHKYLALLALQIPFRMHENISLSLSLSLIILRNAPFECVSALPIVVAAAAAAFGAFGEKAKASGGGEEEAR